MFRTETTQQFIVSLFLKVWTGIFKHSLNFLVGHLIKELYNIKYSPIFSNIFTIYNIEAKCEYQGVGGITSVRQIKSHCVTIFQLLHISISLKLTEDGNAI